MGGEKLGGSGGSAYFVNYKERILYFVFLADHVFFRYSTTYFGIHCRLQRIFGSFLARADNKMIAKHHLTMLRRRYFHLIASSTVMLFLMKKVQEEMITRKKKICVSLTH